jgi:hypothetical protein
MAEILAATAVQVMSALLVSLIVAATQRIVVRPA